MATPAEWLNSHVKHDHERLLERLRSLDHSLDTIFYYGEICSDVRGFGGLRLRCQELREILREHIPEEEKMFERLKGRDEAGRLVARLLFEHRALTASLEACLETLETLNQGEVRPEDLFALQERVRALSTNLQRHITFENERILPLTASA